MDQLLRKSIINEIARNPKARTWLLRLIMAFVIMFSVLIGVNSTPTMLNRIAMLGIGVVGLIILLRCPQLGILGVLVAGFFVRYAGPGGVNVSVIGIAGLTGLWLIGMVIIERRFTINHPPTAVALLVLIVVSIISFMNGQLIWYPLARQAPITAQAGGLAIFVLSACAFLVMANLMRAMRWMQVFTWLFVCIGALYILGRILPWAGSINNRLFQAGATSNSSIFWVWILVIPFSQMLFNHYLHKAWRVALGVLVIGVLYASIVQASSWKSGYLPPLAGAAVIIALLLRHRVIWFIPFGIALALYAGSEALASDQYSYITRVEAWRIVLELTKISPLFGLGFGNYYWYTPLIPILGWSVSFNSHSQFVDIIAQTGIVGLVCVLWIFWEIGKLGWQLKDRVPEGFAKAYVYGSLGGIVGTLTAGGFVDWILPFVYNIGMNGFRGSVLSWLFLGGLVVVNQSIAEPKQKLVKTKTKEGK